METNTDIITADIVDAAYGIHRELGPGLLESVYERLLARELERRGYHVERQKPVAFEHDGLRFEGKLVVDLMVNDRVVVEVKATEKTLPLRRRQTYTYLRVLDLRVGLLLNFGESTMKAGIRRIVNGYRPSPQSRLRIHQRTGRPEPEE